MPMFDRSGLFAIASLLLLSRYVGAIEYHDAARRFTVQIPEGWVKLEPEALAAFNDLGKHNKVQYETGFQPADQVLGVCPWFLIEFRPSNMVAYSFAQFQRSLSKELSGGIRKPDGLLGELTKDIKVGGVEFNATRRRAILRLEATTLGNKVQVISYGMFGKEGVVWLHCYSTEAEFEKNLPNFNALGDSFRYDQGFDFVPGNPRAFPAPKFDLEAMWLPALIVGLVLAAYRWRNLLRKLVFRSRRPDDAATD